MPTMVRQNASKTTDNKQKTRDAKDHCNTTCTFSVFSVCKHVIAFVVGKRPSPTHFQIKCRFCRFPAAPGFSPCLANTSWCFRFPTMRPTTEGSLAHSFLIWSIFLPESIRISTNSVKERIPMPRWYAFRWSRIGNLFIFWLWWCHFAQHQGNELHAPTHSHSLGMSTGFHVPTPS